MKKQAIYEGNYDEASKSDVENKNNNLQGYLDRLQNNKDQNQVYIDLYDEMLKDSSLSGDNISQLNNNLQNRTNNDFMYQFKEMIAKIDSQLWNDYITALKETYNQTDMSDDTFIKEHIQEIVSYFDYTGMAKLYQEYLNSEAEFAKKGYETRKTTRGYYINDNENNIKDIQHDIDAKGGQGTLTQYNNIANLYGESKNFWKEQKADAEAMLAECERGTAAWDEWNTEIQDCEDNIATCDDEINKCKSSILQLPLNDIEEALNQIQKQLDSINDAIDDHESYISAAVGIIDKEIEDQNFLKEIIQDQIDALQEENELRQTNLEIQKAEYNLEKLKNQKTSKVFYENQGWVYEADESAIQDAELAYDTALYNRKLYLLNEQIRSYDKEIERLNEIKEQWNGITSEAQFMLDLNKAMAYDNEFYIKVLEQDLSLVNQISDAYINLVQQRDAYETQQEEYMTLQDVIDETVKLYNLEGITFEEAKQRIADAIRLYYPEIVEQYQDEEATLDRVAEKQLELAGVTEESSEDALEAITESNLAISESYNTLLTDLNDVFGQLTALMNGFADSAQAVAASVQLAIGGIKEKIGALTESEFDVEVKSSGKTTKVKTAGKSHTGLELGYIGESSTSKDKDAFRYFALNKLDDSEIVRVLQRGEAVLDSAQINNVMDNFRKLTQVKVPTLIPNTSQMNQSVNFTGDIVVNGVQDTNSFARAVKSQLPQRMLQELYSNK